MEVLLKLYPLHPREIITTTIVHIQLPETGQNHHLKDPMTLMAPANLL